MTSTASRLAVVQREIGNLVTALDPHPHSRAEHIERCLVEIATRYLNAALIENDDLDDATLERELERALGRPARFPSP